MDPNNVTEVDVHDGAITFRLATFALGSILMMVATGFVTWSLLQDVQTIENSSEIKELRVLMKANQEAIIVQSKALSKIITSDAIRGRDIESLQKEVERLRDEQAAEFRERTRLYNERRGGMQLQPGDGGSGSP